MEKKEWIVEGNVWKVGNNVNTESIEPSNWQQAGEEALMAHVAELLIPEFPKKMQKGDIWVAGSNLGCSSSRNAAFTLKRKGIAAFICHSASRIFYRNAINCGVPIYTIGEEVEKIKMGDRIRINIRTGLIENLTAEAKIQAEPISDFLMEYLDAGGIEEKMRAHKSEYKLWI